MHFRPRLLAGLVAVALANWNPAQADQVTMINGDRLTGTVLHKDRDLLILRTAYAGEVRLRCTDIATVATDEAVEVMLDDGTLTRLHLQPPPPPRTAIPPQPAEPVASAAVDAVSPNVDELVPPAATDAASPAANEAVSPNSDADALAAIIAATTPEPPEPPAPAEPPEPPVPPLSAILFIKPTPEESGVGHRSLGHAGLALSSTRGNSSNDSFHGDAEWIRRARAFRTTLSGEGNYGRDSGDASASNWRASGRYDRFFNPKEFLYAKAALENDRFRDLRLRGTVGGGYGYQLYEDDTTTLSVRGGLKYIDVSHYELAREGYGALGWGVDFRRSLQMFPATLFHTQEGTWGGEGHGTELQSRTGLRLPVGDGISFTAQVNLDWESRPAPGRNATDTTVLFGLGYTLH